MSYRQSVYEPATGSHRQPHSIIDTAKHCCERYIIRDTPAIRTIQQQPYRSQCSRIAARGDTDIIDVEIRLTSRSEDIDSVPVRL